jgi:DNA polymerase-3 subunit epsilon
MITGLPHLEEVSPEWGTAGYIDVETTGLYAAHDEIIELALVVFAFDRAAGNIIGIVDEYTGLREPGVPISPGAARVNGITPDMLAGQHLDAERVARLIGRCEFMVAHNARFDRGFMVRLFPECRDKTWLCSMNDVDWRGKGCPSKGLQALLAHHGIQVSVAHRGEADVKNALALLCAAGPDGVPYFCELLKKHDRLAADAESRPA